MPSCATLSRRIRRPLLQRSRGDPNPTQLQRNFAVRQKWFAGWGSAWANEPGGAVGGRGDQNPHFSAKIVGDLAFCQKRTELPQPCWHDPRLALLQAIPAGNYGPVPLGSRDGTRFGESSSGLRTLEAPDTGSCRDGVSPRQARAGPDRFVGTDFQKLQRIPRQFARWQNAQQQLVSGRPSSALASYHDLVQRFPGVAQLWFELGIAEMGALNFALAERAFRRAGELAPRDVSLLVLLGQQFHRLRCLDQARECFERAVAVDPSSVHARLSLAAWLERERRLDAAWECVEACLAEHPKDPQARCVRALLLHRQGRNAEAETVLRDLLRAGRFEPSVSHSIQHLLALVLDAVGQYPEALQCLCAAKAQARRMANTTRMEQDYDRADRYRRELLAEMTPETVQRWRAEGSAPSSSWPLAFLGGHPRSGTTLLEQILDAHPNLLAFDESEAFSQEVWFQLAPMQATQALDLKRLNDLAPDRRAELCDRYLKSLLRESPAASNASVWLDKNPSPTAALHLWLRLFPASKVIIALRDPRDIVVSCFFQNLALTPTNANFLSLERTVKHYSDLMDVWVRLRDLGGFDWLETRYEDLVANMENEGRRVTSFLGLDWDPAQARFHEVAARKFVFSPTYNDATQSVHNRAVGRWRHYAEALAPFQQHLAPYCRAFGYALE